jgi:hypothetical protein
VNFEWDDTKRKLNIKKHGIDFINASMIFDSYTLTIKDDRYDYGEERLSHLGFLKEGSLWLYTRKMKTQ